MQILHFRCFFTFPLAPAYLYAEPKNCSMSAVLPSRVDTESLSMDWTSTSTRMPSSSTGSGSLDIADWHAFLANGFSVNLNILNTIILHSPAGFGLMRAFSCSSSSKSSLSEISSTRALLVLSAMCKVEGTGCVSSVSSGEVAQEELGVVLLL